MKKFNTPLRFIFALLVWQASVSNTKAQNGTVYPCGTDEYYKAQVKLHPEMAVSRQKADSIAALAYYRFQAQAKTSTAPDTATRVVPVVFHVIYEGYQENISQYQINSEIATLNQTFNALNSDTSQIRPLYKSRKGVPHYRFALATKDPNGNCTTGIERIKSRLTVGDSAYLLTPSPYNDIKALSDWPFAMYLNVWVVKSLFSQGLPPGESLAGFAQFPWDAYSEPKTDGIMIGYQFVGGGQTVLTHEIGHWLGLYHTFQPAISGTNDSVDDGCTGNPLDGDDIYDTPPQAIADFGCPDTASCPNSNDTIPGGHGLLYPNMTEDYMDYSDCRHMFTAGQVLRMRALSDTLRTNIFTPQNIAATLGSCLAGIPPQTEFENSVQVYPDPAINAFVVAIDAESSGKVSFSITDMAGKVISPIREMQIAVGQNQFSFTKGQMNITNPGMYYLLISQYGYQMVKKIVFTD